MPRLSRNALSAAMVRSAGPGNYVDGNGLMLRVRKSGTRQWIQRLMIHGRRVDLGLGSADLVKLADARKVAADNRAIARTGGDPRRSRVPTFEKAEAACFAEKRDTWRSDSPAHNWRPAMDRYVLPKIGGMPVRPKRAGGDAWTRRLDRHGGRRRQRARVMAARKVGPSRMSDRGPNTLAVHAGEAPDPATGASAPNLIMSTTFALESPQGFSINAFEGELPYIYARWGNPTLSGPPAPATGWRVTGVDPPSWAP